MRTFATWVPNSKDNAALDAAHAVAHGVPDALNPLVLIGRTGAGKTHLLHAIAAELRRRLSPDSILHLSTAAFIDRFVRAMRADTVSDFRHWLNSFDAILLDDVHLFADRERTFQEIVLTLSERAAAGAQVVATSDVRLRGMTAAQVEIKRPDAAARAKILQATAEQRGFAISENDARVIARRIHGNVRKLHAAVWRLIAERSIAGNVSNAEEMERVTALVEGGEAARARRFYERALRLRGKLRLDINLKESRDR